MLSLGRFTSDGNEWEAVVSAGGWGLMENIYFTLRAHVRSTYRYRYSQTIIV